MILVTIPRFVDFPCGVNEMQVEKMQYYVGVFVKNMSSGISMRVILES